ncbi:MAG TPA: porin family protein [Burkholderiales bacterium]|jgi:OOP family OmpA-OmpF porin
MTSKGWIAAVIGAAAMLSCGAATAQKQSDAGWYAGASLGRADLGPDKDTAIKIFGGYQINRSFAAEFGYTDLGDVTVGNNSVNASAWELTGLGKFPLGNQFYIYGLAGLAKVKSESTVSGLRVSDDSTELTFGFGLQYDFSPQVGARLQWQRYDTSDEIDVVSVGVVYRF